MVYNKKSRATSDFVAAYEKTQYEDSFDDLLAMKQLADMEQ